MKQKTVWITGASSGIGEALAKTYHERGWRLILSARREEKLQELAARLGDTDRIEVVPLDLERTDTLPAIVESVMERIGHLDVLFNNGGISQRGRAVDTPLSVDRRIMEIDYFGTVALTKALLPYFIKQGSGNIAVTSSLVGIISTPDRTAYSAAKHALHGFFDGLRTELYEHGIGVTLLCPGFIRTAISTNALTETGERLGTMDDAQANGMDPEVCARKMIRAIERGKHEVYIGGKETLGVYVKRFFPSLFARIVRKAKVR